MFGEEHGTERHVLEDRPASDESHAARQVVTVGLGLVCRLTARLLLILRLLMFAAKMLTPLCDSTLLFCTCVTSFPAQFSLHSTSPQFEITAICSVRQSATATGHVQTATQGLSFTH